MNRNNGIDMRRNCPTLNGIAVELGRCRWSKVILSSRYNALGDVATPIEESQARPPGALIVERPARRKTFLLLRCTAWACSGPPRPGATVPENRRGWAATVTGRPEAIGHNTDLARIMHEGWRM
jgi:hypothetical protein